VVAAKPVTSHASIPNNYSQQRRAFTALPPLPTHATHHAHPHHGTGSGRPPGHSRAAWHRRDGRFGGVAPAVRGDLQEEPGTDAGPLVVVCRHFHTVFHIWVGSQTTIPGCCFGTWAFATVRMRRSWWFVGNKHLPYTALPPFASAVHLTFVDGIMVWLQRTGVPTADLHSNHFARSHLPFCLVWWTAGSPAHSQATAAHVVWRRRTAYYSP